MCHGLLLAGALAFTNRLMLVRPLVFLAANCRLAVIGTSTDLAMVGACPLALAWL